MQAPVSVPSTQPTNRRSLLILTILLAALVPILFLMAKPFLTSFILAGVLAIVVHPVHQWVGKKVKRSGWATTITTVGTILILGSLVVFTGLAFTRELQSSYKALSEKSLEEGGWPALISRTTDRVADALANRVHMDKEAIREEFIERTRAATEYLLQHLGDAVGGVTSAVFTGIATSFFLYFLLRYGDIWMRKLKRLSPLDADVNARLIRTVQASITAAMNGVVAVAAAQGAALALGFWICGVRAPILWGVIGGLASIVPVIGAPLVWVPIVIAFAFMSAWWKVVFLGIWGGLIVGSIDNILRPFVVGAGANLHPMLMAIAALGGTYAFGALGILFGPLIVSLAGALIEEIQRAREAEASS